MKSDATADFEQATDFAQGVFETVVDADVAVKIVVEVFFDIAKLGAAEDDIV